MIEILDVVRNAGEARVLSMEHLPPDLAVARVAEDVKDAVISRLSGRTLLDLLADDDAAAAPSRDRRRATGD